MVLPYVIDSSDRTHLPVCQIAGCSWRGDPEPSKLAALTSMARHQRLTHADDLGPGGWLRAHETATRRAGRRMRRLDVLSS